MFTPVLSLVQDVVDPRKEQLLPDRFSNEIHGAQFETAYLILFAGTAGQEDNRRDDSFLIDHFGQFEAVQVRHVDVRKYQIKILLLETRQGFYPVFGDGHIIGNALQNAGN